MIKIGNKIYRNLPEQVKKNQDDIEVLKTHVPYEDAFYTREESDERYEAKGTSYSKAEADERFEPIDTSYTKAEADERFEPIDTSYTKAEADELFYTKTEADSKFSNKLSVTTKYIHKISFALSYNPEEDDIVVVGYINLTDTKNTEYTALNFFTDLFTYHTSTGEVTGSGTFYDEGTPAPFTGISWANTAIISAHYWNQSSKAENTRWLSLSNLSVVFVNDNVTPVITDIEEIEEEE